MASSLGGQAWMDSMEGLRRNLRRVFSDAFERWSLGGKPPYRVECVSERYGFYAVMDSGGVNRARGPHGAVLLTSEEAAEALAGNDTQPLP